MHKHPAYNENGFTLIEVIVSLVLIGIMAAMAGMFFVAITKGYIFSQQNNETSLKAQLSMAKMVKEIGSLRIETDRITAAAPTSISYTYTDPVTGAAANHTIALSGTLIQFTTGTDTVTLVDKVNSFTLTYYISTSTTALSMPVTATDRPKIRRVDITLSMQGAEGVVSTFADSAKILESYY